MDEKAIKQKVEELIRLAGTEHYQVREEGKGRNKVIVRLELSFLYTRDKPVDKRRRGC